MNSASFLPTEKLYALLDWEAFVILASMSALAWFFYKIFLREATTERHKSLKRQLYSLSRHFAMMTMFFFIFVVLREWAHDGTTFQAVEPYVALFAVLEGIYVFIRASRLLLLQYLFLGSMRLGVPILIVNIFSLAMTIGLVLWLVSSVFGVNLGPLLATSAVFSIILGLALQDTLGNIFAGISMQIDKAFEIGDWLEVYTGSQKVVGQVREITWRATGLVGWSDEVITIPNRTMASSQISNFATTNAPIIRSQNFRLDYLVDAELAKNILIDATKKVSGVKPYPNPACFISDTTDSWLTFKLIYYVDDYGAQYTVGDRVMSAGIQALNAQGIKTTVQTLKLLEVST